jgi:L-asparaginase
MTLSEHSTNDADLPVIAILATGGTIAGAGSSAVKGTYTSGQVSVEALLEAVPQLEGIARVRGEQIARVGSQAITSSIWLDLTRRVNALLTSNGVAGVVITHGTDTMEETAYFLHLTVNSDKPVVFVGAMRPSTAISADGPANIYNAVTLAVDPRARGQGVLVAMNDSIYAARDVAKTHTTNVATFQSPGAGPLGTAANGRVNFYSQPTRTHTTASEFSVDELDALPKVAILYGYAGDNSALVEASVNAGFAGIVFAGVGNGNLNPQVQKALAAAVKNGVAVVRSSRTGSGRVTLDGEVNDTKHGFVVADDLNPQKARVLLMLGLTRTRDPERIQEMFFKY